MRNRGARFVRSEVRSPSGEIVVDIGKSSPGVHRRRAGTQPEVKVSRIVKLGGIGRIRLGYLLKNVVVNQNAVLVLAGSRAELLKGLEFSHLRFAVVVHAGCKRRRIPFEGAFGIFVRAETVVIGAGVIRECLYGEQIRNFASAKNQVVSEVEVGYGRNHPACSSDQGVVIDEDSRRSKAELQRASFRRVVNDVAHEVHRAAEHRLSAQRPVRVIEAAIPENPDVVRSAVRLDAIVVNVADIVVVKVDGNRQAIPDRVRGAVRVPVSSVVDSVVEVGYVIVGDDVPEPYTLTAYSDSNLFGKPGSFCHVAPIQPIRMSDRFLPMKTLSAM